MTDPQEQRGTDRSASPIRRPERCRRRRFIIPNTYEELEALVERWMAGCVQSRTIVSDRGTGRPARRERELVQNNRSLRLAWSRMRYIRGRWSGLEADYVTPDGIHVEEVMFSMIPMHAVIGEGDLELTELLPPPPLPPPTGEPPDTRPPGGGPPEPDIPEPPPSEFIMPSGNLIEDMKKVLEIMLEGYEHALESQYQLPYYHGVADGYCNTIALAAVDQRLRQALRVSGFRASEELVDTRGPIPNDARMRCSGSNVRGCHRGYREGRRLAHQWLLSHERVAHDELPTYESAKLLFSVRHHHGPQVWDIRGELLHIHFPDHPGASPP